MKPKTTYQIQHKPFGYWEKYTVHYTEESAREGYDHLIKLEFPTQYRLVKLLTTVLDGEEDA